MANGDEAFTDETLQFLLSVADDRCGGTFPVDLPAKLRCASSASLFILSRRAFASLVRTEAQKTLTARLREDDVPETPAPADAATGDELSPELPPELATHRHFYKFQEHERWVLTTRSGRRVADFSSEADLDQWWRGLKKQRGRILTRVRRDTPAVLELPAERPEDPEGDP